MESQSLPTVPEFFLSFPPDVTFFFCVCRAAVSIIQDIPHEISTPKLSTNHAFLKSWQWLKPQLKVIKVISCGIKCRCAQIVHFFHSFLEIILSLARKQEEKRQSSEHLLNLMKRNMSTFIGSGFLNVRNSSWCLFFLNIGSDCSSIVTEHSGARKLNDEAQPAGSH